MRGTHTYAVLEVSKSAWDEIAGRLREAGYDHAFSLDGKTIDMHGIAVEARTEPEMITVQVWGEPSDSDWGPIEHAIVANAKGRRILSPPEVSPAQRSTHRGFSFGVARVTYGTGLHPGTGEEGIMTRIDVLVEP